VLGDQIINSFYKNAVIPINWLYPHTDIVIKFTSEAKIIKENCQIARNWA